MTTTAVLLERLSDWYDKHKPDVKEIRVNLTRASCMKFVKPQKRGGALIYRGRQLIHKPVKRPGAG